MLESTSVIPIFLPSSYYKNAHIQTILPTLFRNVNFNYTSRERIELADGDFIDIDHFQQGGEMQVLLLHGLESNSQQAYMKGMARSLATELGCDIAVLNFRGCSGVPNRLFRSYHSGVSDDVNEVFLHLCHQYSHYKYRAAVGFSLGGNVLLKWLGSESNQLKDKLVASVAVSVPCDLAASAKQLAKPSNKIYLNRFLKKLRQKVMLKIPLSAGKITASQVEQVRDFLDFDNLYTAPAHGYLDANDYWKKCSSKSFLSEIRVPTLLINAQNDPFLVPECFPSSQEINNDFVQLLYPKQGGHVGFLQKIQQPIYWHEQQTINFIKDIINRS